MNPLSHSTRPFSNGLTILAVASGLLCTTIQPANSADWRQFRGNAANSVAVGEQLPTELSGETIAWQVDLPGRGLSSPIIVRDQVIVTASSGYSQDRLRILSFNAKSGALNWERQFEATGRTVCHDKMCVATPTPASDGQHIFAFYSSNDMICLDMSGNLQWYRGLGSEFPNASNSLGMSSSPIVVGSTVIAQVESDAEAFAIGIDTVSGETKWQIDRPRKANWTSPTILSTDGGLQLALLQSSAGVTAIDPETGTTAWEYDNGASTIPSSTVANGAVIIPSHGLTVLKPGSDSFAELWNASNLSPGTSSPVVAEDLAFSVNSAGVVSAADIESGKRLWQLRLKGPFSGTPLASNGHLFFFNESGLAFVVKAERDKGEIISQLDLTETILCSPAASDNALYIRSDGHLWKFADSQ